MSSDYTTNLYQGGPWNLAPSTLSTVTGARGWTITYLCPFMGTIHCVDCEHPPVKDCLWDCWQCKDCWQCPCWRCDRLCDSCDEVDCAGRDKMNL